MRRKAERKEWRVKAAQNLRENGDKDRQKEGRRGEREQGGIGGGNWNGGREGEGGGKDNWGGKRVKRKRKGEKITERKEVKEKGNEEEKEWKKEEIFKTMKTEEEEDEEEID